MTDSTLTETTVAAEAQEAGVSLMSVAPATGRAKLIVEYIIIQATYLNVGCSDCSQVHRCSKVVCQGVCGYIGEDTIILVTDSGVDAVVFLVRVSTCISYIFFSRFVKFFSRFYVRSLEYSYVFSDPNILIRTEVRSFPKNVPTIF
jgi:hypothetical protein